MEVRMVEEGSRRALLARSHRSRRYRRGFAGASGRDNWRYTLFREAAIGDVGFHYAGAANGIERLSRFFEVAGVRGALR